MIATQGRMVNPDLERLIGKHVQSKTIKRPGSHAIFLSHARAPLIEKAAAAK
jgi:hypothetical protein